MTRISTHPTPPSKEKKRKRTHAKAKGRTQRTRKHERTHPARHTHTHAHACTRQFTAVPVWAQHDTGYEPPARSTLRWDKIAVVFTRLHSAIILYVVVELLGAVAARHLRQRQLQRAVRVEEDHLVALVQLPGVAAADADQIGSALDVRD